MEEKLFRRVFNENIENEVNQYEELNQHLNNLLKFNANNNHNTNDNQDRMTAVSNAESLESTKCDNLIEKFNEIKNTLKTEHVHKIIELNEHEIELFNILRDDTDIERFESHLGDNTEKIRKDVLDEDGDSLLIKSIKLNKKVFMEYLIKIGVNLNIKDKFGRSALQLALLINVSPEIVSRVPKGFCNTYLILITLNEDLKKLASIEINARDDSGSTVLHYISATNKLNLLDYLQTKRNSDLKNFDYTVTDNEGLTCVHRAVYSRNVNMINRLVQLFNIKLSHNCKFSVSILNHILRNGNLEMLKWWFDSVHDLPDRFIDDQLLMFEVDGENSEILTQKIEFLCTKKGNIDKINTDGNNLMMHLVNKNAKFDKDLFEYFVNDISIAHTNNYNQNINHLLAKKGYLLILKNSHHSGFLLDSFNKTPLIHAIESGQIGIVKWMKSLTKVDQNLINAAIKSKKYEIYKLLTNFDVDFDEIYHNHLLKPLEIFRHVNTHQFHALNLSFIAKDNNINCFDAIRVNEELKNVDLKTIFILKCIKYYSVDEIIDAGIPIEKYRDDLGATAVHLAAAFGRNDIIIWLAHNRYNIFYKYFSIHSTDQCGYTALHYAALNGHTSTVILLRLLGVNYINES